MNDAVLRQGRLLQPQHSLVEDVPVDGSSKRPGDASGGLRPLWSHELILRVRDARIAPAMAPGLPAPLPGQHARRAITTIEQTAYHNCTPGHEMGCVLTHGTVVVLAEKLRKAGEHQL